MINVLENNELSNRIKTSLNCNALDDKQNSIPGEFRQYSQLCNYRSSRREDQPLSIGLQSKINNIVAKGMFIIYLKLCDGSIREVLSSCQLVSSNVLASRRLVTSTNLISVTVLQKMKQQKRHKLQLFYDILSAIEQDMYQNEGTSLAKPTRVQQY